MSERREYATGTIEKRGGRFSPRIRLPDGTRKRLETCDSWDEAERLLEAFREELAASGMPVVGGTTLAGYGARWLDRRELDGLKDVGNDRSRWTSHVVGTELAELPLSGIRRDDVRRWVHVLSKKKATRVKRRADNTVTRTRSRKPIGRETVRHTLGLVRRCLEAAVEDGLIEANPAAGVRVPKRQDPHDEEWTFLSLEEIEQLTTSPELTERQRLAYTVAIYTGLRQGELWALEWRDVSLGGPRPEIHVRRSWDGSTKGNRARRVPLLPAAQAALSRLRELTRGQPFVFPAPGGGRYGRGYDGGWEDRPKRRGKAQLGHRSRAGIRRHVRFHDLRHTCASHLVSGSWGHSWRLEDVRDFLGHKDIRETQRYAHLMPSAIHAAAAATNGPKTVPSTAAESRKHRRTLRDSNPRPSAPEDCRKSNDPNDITVEMGPSWDHSIAELVRGPLNEREPDRADAVEFARGVLDAPAFRAAVAVLEAPDEHLGSRVLDLIDLVGGTRNRGGALPSPASGADEGR